MAPQDEKAYGLRDVVYGTGRQIKGGLAGVKDVLAGAAGSAKEGAKALWTGELDYPAQMRNTDQMMRGFYGGAAPAQPAGEISAGTSNIPRLASGHQPGSVYVDNYTGASNAFTNNPPDYDGAPRSGAPGALPHLTNIVNGKIVKPELQMPFGEAALRPGQVDPAWLKANPYTPQTAGALKLPAYDPNNPRMLQMRTGIAREVDPQRARQLQANMAQSGGGQGSAIDRILSRVGSGLGMAREGEVEANWNNSGPSFRNPTFGVGSANYNPSGVSKGRFYKGQVDLQQTRMNNEGAAARQASEQRASMSQALAVKALDMEHQGRADDAAALRAMALEQFRQEREDTRADKERTSRERSADVAGDYKVNAAIGAAEAKSRMAADADVTRRQNAYLDALSTYMARRDPDAPIDQAYVDAMYKGAGIPTPTVAAPAADAAYAKSLKDKFKK